MQDLYLFNPDNEISVANGTNGYTPKANIALMADELALLMAYVAGERDHVVVSRLPEAGFWERRRGLFGVKAEPILWEKVRLLSFRELRPWGWSPRVHNLFEEVKTHCDEIFQKGVMAEWSSERRELYSRRRAAECLTYIGERVSSVERGIVPWVCCSLEEVREVSLSGDVVVKAPWSSSGKGILFVEREKLMKKEEEIVSGMLHKQGYVMVERRLDRVLDFAMEFMIEKGDGVHFLGYSVFKTGKRGEYEGNVVASRESLEGIITSYVEKRVIDEIRRVLTDALTWKYGEKYVGCLGVDMMIYKDVEGQYKVQPCVEINLRYNMGIVALCLQRHLAKGIIGYFQIRYSDKPGEILRSVLEFGEQHPLHVGDGGIDAGYIYLTPVGEETRFIAELFIGGSNPDGLRNGRG